MHYFFIFNLGNNHMSPEVRLDGHKPLVCPNVNNVGHTHGNIGSLDWATILKPNFK